MAKVEKLKSGSYRIRIYAGTDENGKKVYKSFTAKSSAQVKQMAQKYENSKPRTTCAVMTVEKAIDDYITIKTKTLSPSTIRSYRNLQQKYYKELAQKDIYTLSNSDVQKMINNLDNGTLSLKSIKNIYTLFTAALKFQDKGLYFTVTLPEIDNPDEITLESVMAKTTATDAEVRLLYRAALPWLQKCIALAAFSSLRRGEIAAIRYKDILPEKNQIFIHTSFTMNEDNEWVLKTPKTRGSVRLVNVPKEVVELLGTGNPEEFVIGYNPNTISKMFIKLRDAMGVNITFHDLRHYWASIGNVIHVPDVILADFGGWEHNSPVMKKIYQNKKDDDAEYWANRMNEYFSDNIINIKEAR